MHTYINTHINTYKTIQSYMLLFFFCHRSPQESTERIQCFCITTRIVKNLFYIKRIKFYKNKIQKIEIEKDVGKGGNRKGKKEREKRREKKRKNNVISQRL